MGIYSCITFCCRLSYGWYSCWSMYICYGDVIAKTTDGFTSIFQLGNTALTANQLSNLLSLNSWVDEKNKKENEADEE